MLIVFLNILFVFYSLSLRGVSTAENLTPKDASLSKALSWLLRHGAIDEGLTVSEDGYIKLEEVLQHRLFARRYTPTDIRLVVNLCKNRFTLRTNPVTGIYEIRANSGHTFKDRNNQGNKKSDPKVRGRTYPQTNLKSGKNYNHQQFKNNKYDDLLKNYNIPVGNIADKENNNKRGRKNVYKSLMKYPELKKNLLWILRYGSEKEGLTVKRHGYVAVDELMNHSHFKDKCMREDIITVANNEPHNFKLRESPSTQQLYIRARKEHPIKQEQEDWSVIPDVLYIPLGFVIHGINGSDWDFVSEHGLKVPKTGYLYCSPYYAADSWHTRGVTKYDDIYIHIDCGAAMRDGIEFFLTPEYSVATKGDKDGFIRTQYFKKVIEAKSGDLLFSDGTDDGE
ncbi:uncharacterized protein LOC128985921 [Macrosteles quadrilineatus]|uniref:uncharacterized protein LOC128985921 n=1 Tax=Macrosteles quadrilineatus TaxID=74068 RepID=UPI0023E2A184|nr:uncharacterized protein LOC128985921 [Macrosteles quadrilineatus]